MEEESGVVLEQSWRPRLLAALRAVPQSPYVWANVVYVVRVSPCACDPASVSLHEVTRDYVLTLACQRRSTRVRRWRWTSAGPPTQTCWPRLLRPQVARYSASHLCVRSRGTAPCTASTSRLQRSTW